MKQIIEACFLLGLLSTSFNLIAMTGTTNSNNYETVAPSEHLRLMVTEAWNLMYPKDGVLPDYKKAYELNDETFNLGHAEGASNIGLMYEKGLGVAKDVSAATKWYLIAHSSNYHSAQAEIGLARITLQKPHTKENLSIAASYIRAARNNAMDSKSLWYEESNSFLQEIDNLQEYLDSFGL
jgi:TPR repeat protein